MTDTTVRAALAELVVLKKLKGEIETLAHGGFKAQATMNGLEYEPKYLELQKLEAEYKRRKPLAWAAAEAALSAPPAEPTKNIDARLKSLRVLIRDDTKHWAPAVRKQALDVIDSAMKNGEAL